MYARPMILAAGCLAAALLLTACGRQDAVSDPVRAVKLETITAGGHSASSDYVATVRQRERADLAFESGGRIANVLVEVGDPIRQGQVLARLDAEPARLRLAQADANLHAASAQWQERQTQLRQQQAMFADGSISQATLTGAQTALDAAQGQWRGAQAERDLASRAQRLTELRAPFDGVVVARLMQPQTEAAPGQAVLQVEGRGRLQVVVALPPQQAAGLRPGAAMHARDATGHDLALRLRAVSTHLDGGVTVQALFDFTDPAIAVHSGDSLLLTLPTGDGAVASVPLAGVLPSARDKVGRVFVFRPMNGIVRQREVVLGDIEGARVQVLEGLVTGEQVVAVGAAFLTDGQQVQPYRPASRLEEGSAP